MVVRFGDRVRVQGSDMKSFAMRVMDVRGDVLLLCMEPSKEAIQMEKTKSGDPSMGEENGNKLLNQKDK